ncbi:YihY/virulence factor BrkB family protein [Nocardioides acrostichi]|uniref:YihY/virulence factor BrkB family protein n=1 Tax=Nocardioides acrostichi TaxID=2784339 RepID=A0A930YCT0_9ACTN|nr:YhjD/YihY/BrkB family envelope integrity protein [Nocardioides acrostichi]MBF4161754.1 YihY/virulence factor BrkB family protein [Nocardioides acrostichi]
MPSIKERIEEVRQRRPAIDHLVRMQEHFGAVSAGQQAGAVTYFAFLSFFPILALAFFAVGVVSNVVDGADAALRSALQGLFPGIIGGDTGLQLKDFRTFSGLAGVIGFAGVLYSGLGWVSALRQAIVTVFELPEDEQLGFVPGKLRDLMVLVSLGGTLLVSVGLGSLVTRFSGTILDFLGLDQTLAWLVSTLTVLLGFAANVALFFIIYALLGRGEVPRGPLLRAAVIGAVGFEILKQVAGVIIASTSGQPAGQAFGIALVMLVWINYFTRLVLYAACWAYTAPAARAQRADRVEAEGAVQGPPLPSGTDADALAGSTEAEATESSAGEDAAEGGRARTVKGIAAGAAGVAAAAAVVRKKRRDDA